MKQYFEIIYSFFWLGCISFGGPAAHIGYFRKVFVEEKRWLDQEHYGQLVALSQFLPGPGSSQVGFSIGLHRGGLIGACLAFISFTLPSFLIMLSLAVGYQSFSNSDGFSGLLQAFKLLALVVVIDATLGMAKNFCQTKVLKAIALMTAIFLLLANFPYHQIAALVGAAIIGSLFIHHNKQETPSLKAPQTHFAQPNLGLLALFFVLLAVCLYFTLNLFTGSFVAGSLVFGGGHVVLPLLEQQMIGLVTPDEFLAGYAAAQAVPGPMFTFATFLGAMAHETPWIGALIATAGIFLPGFLLVLVFHKSWRTLANHSVFSAAISSVNAAVVGLLIATCYQPVFTQAITDKLDVAFALFLFALLKVFNAHISVLVGICLLWGLLVL